MPPLFILPLLFWPQYFARLYVAPCEYLRPCSRHHVWPKYRDVFNVFVFVSAFFSLFRFFVFVCFFFQWRCPWCLMGLVVINLDLAHWKIVSSQVMSSNAHWWDDGEEENCAKTRYRYCDHGESTDFPPQVITGFQMFYVHLGEYATCRPPNKIIDMFMKIWWFALRLHSRT